MERPGRDKWMLWGLGGSIFATSLLFAGCPSNTCLLTVNGKCEWSTCPDGSDFDTQRRACVCQRNRVSLGGSCLTYEAANQYCGKGAHFENGGRAPHRWAPGRASDQETGQRNPPPPGGPAAADRGDTAAPKEKT